MAAGIDAKIVAQSLDITTKELETLYADELEFGLSRANARVVQNLLDIATGNTRQAVAAIKLWLTNRAGWTDKSTHELTGPDGKPIETTTVELDEATVEAIRRRYITNTD